MAAHSDLKKDKEFANEYSRLLAASGMEALLRMQASSVLLVGLKGLGAEIAKNIVLMGIRRLTIVDTGVIALADLSSNFLFTTEDVGKPRGATSVLKLRELNDRVDFDVYEGDLTVDFLKAFSVVVCTNNSSLSELLRVSDICHANQVKFIAADSRGLFGAVFTDFNSHLVFDKNGEPAKTAYLNGITNEAEGLVTCVDSERHDLEDGDVVEITEVQGMSEINGKEFPVKVVGPYSFTIGDTTAFSQYTARGFMREIKKPKMLQFQSLRERLESFDMMKVIHPDGEKIFTAGGDFFLFFQALLTFQESHSGALPRPYNREDLTKILAIAEDLNKKVQAVETINQALFRQLTYTSSGDLNPMAAFLGGVVAQEVMKACSGKYLPLDQFLFYDSLLSASIPDNDENINTADYSPIGSRYDGQIVVFGKQFHDVLANLKYFLVGSGAIGCEMLKNWALMGLSTGPKGEVSVTDMDIIEVSNLNRQFLFRRSDVGKGKAEVAAAAALKMNPEVKIIPSKNKVSPETTAAFPTSFWKSLSGVCNALDNVEARKYVDSLCVRYGKSLLESGTLGPKGNTQVVVPHLTESYSSSADPPSASIPLCSLHTFPARIEHTLAWSRQVVFDELFIERMENVKKYFSDPQFIQKQQEINRRKVVEGLEQDLLVNKPKTFSDCVNWALTLFNQYYNHAVLQLLSVFPRDYVDKNGAPFYTGTKRPPHALIYDPSQEDHLDFVVSAAFLRAYCFGLVPSELKPEDFEAQRAKVAAETASYVHPPFVPKKNIAVVGVDEPGSNNNGGSSSSSAGTADEPDDVYVARIVEQLKGVSPFPVAALEFEKDVDENFHVDFVNAASNLRATTFEIPTVDRLQSKLIAGKIIPAMITTTAVVAGLVCFELYKLFAPVPKKLDDYKNTFLNLAIASFNQGAPMKPTEGLVFNGKPFTLWDRIEIQGDITFNQLFDIFRDEHNMEVEMVAYGPSLIWSGMLMGAKRTERLHRKITDVVSEVAKTTITESILPITVMGVDMDGEEIENIPDVYLNLAKDD